MTLFGDLSLRRAYYYCGVCKAGFCPWDEMTRIQQGLSNGVRSLVALAGALLPFEAAAEDVLRRLSGVRLSTSTVLRVTEDAGRDVQRQLRDDVLPAAPEPGWTAPREQGLPQAYLGVDAFSVPLQGPGGQKAEHRMLYLGRLYTPDKACNRYLVDFDLDALTARLRRVASSCGLREVTQLVAVTDGGNGIEESLKRAFAEDLPTVLDWYHAAQHLHQFAELRYGVGDARAWHWSHKAKEVLYKKGGTALLTYLRRQYLPRDASAELQESWRRLQGYFDNNKHRTDYPRYRAQGWDIGSGPTEAGCKMLGARLKGSGMRWVPEGAEAVAALRGLYLGGSTLWDNYWQPPAHSAA